MQTFSRRFDITLSHRTHSRVIVGLNGLAVVMFAMGACAMVPEFAIVASVCAAVSIVLSLDNGV